jgi:fused signal recognition particle receptor
MSWIEKLKNGLAKTSDKISGGITGIFTKKKLDQESLDQLEELLIISDIGVSCAADIIKNLSKNRFDKEITDLEIKQILASNIEEKLSKVESELKINSAHKPHVVLVCGVNGNGKTTTIGKLANFYQSEGHKVMIGACDTFRAAAVSQLKTWADRAGCEFTHGDEMADPASVAYLALENAKKQNCDLLLIDTAGRLQNKTNLMEELAKIIRVIKKLDPDAPHDTILVLDATTGQNAHSQVESFKNMVNITGLVVTKLDGTAKAGVIVALAEKFNINIHAIGVGESISDLRPFRAGEFARSLVGL